MDTSTYKIMLVNEIDNNEHMNDDNNESKTNLIINYLPQSLTYDEFRILFQRYGELESCKLVCDKLTGNSLCYGFVNFLRIEDAEKAYKELNGLKVLNKVIKVSFARPSSETIKGANLYVCGLPKHWTTAEFNSYFSECGKIITSRILYHSNTNQSKGVGFIRFDQRYEAELAIQRLNGSIPIASNDNTQSSLQQEPIKVKLANFSEANLFLNNSTNKLFTLPATVPATFSDTAIFNHLINNQYHSLSAIHHHQVVPTIQAQTQTTPQTIYSFPPYTTLVPTTAIPEEYLNTTKTSLDAFASFNGSNSNLAASIENSTRLPASTGWCLFVYNLPQEAEDNILWQLFGPFGAVQNIKLIRDYQTKKCKGFGFVTMTNYEEAVMAISSLNGFTLGNRILQVSFKKNRQNSI